ncbi:MAG: ATP-binding cassette domain-containing protein [Rhizobium sp.]
MGARFDKTILRAMGATEHEMTVVGVTDITPGFRRIRFRASTMIDGRETPPASYLRLWAPDPDNPGKVHQRGYTLVDPDPQTGEVTLDFVRHHPSGPASAWAVEAQPGDTIKATFFAYKKFEPPEAKPAGYLLMGDAAVFPAINAILKTLPTDTRITVILQDNDPGDAAIPVTLHPGAEYLRTGPGTDALADAVPVRDWSDWHAWIAGESKAVKALRARLSERHGFPLADITHAAYWIRGKEMRLRKERPEDETSVRDSGPAVDPLEAPVVSEGTAMSARSGSSAGKDDRNVVKGRWRSQAADGILKPLTWKLRVAGVIQAAAALMQIIPLILMAELARRLLSGGHDWGSVASPVIWALVFFGLSGLLSAGLLFWLHDVDAVFGRDLRLRIVGKLSRLPLGWFSDRNAAFVRQAVDDDASRLHYRITHAVPDLVAAIVTPLATLLYLFSVNAGLAGLLFIPLLLYVILFIRMLRGQGDNIARAADWSKRTTAAAGSFIDALPVLRIFGGGVREIRDTLSGQSRFLGVWQRSMAGRKIAAQLTVQPPTFLLVICTGGLWLVQRGSMMPVDLVPFLVLGTSFGPQISAILYSRIALRESAAATRRIGALLGEEELDQTLATGGLPAGPIGLAFRNATFGYRTHRKVLDDITLDCPPGSVTALVGPSGGGKSTLAALPGRFHDVTGGAVCLTVGDRAFDIRTLRPEVLQRSMGFVFQDVRMIAGTIAENILLARPDATRADMKTAASAAQIHDSIMRLPRGYDSVIGEDVHLSGGEAQRLSIARTLIADPPVLILDEATAMADPDSEYLIQQALNRVAAGRTVLVVAHRLHTIVGADRIVVVKDGRILEEGRHESLVAQGGLYASLWQAGGHRCV